MRVIPLRNGASAPDFALSDQYGAQVRLSDFRRKQPVALVFFPLAFTGTCTSEWAALRDGVALERPPHLEILGISVDSKATLRAFADAEGIEFTLLSDFWPHGDVARSYGVFLEEQGYANRATFVIDVDGVVRSSVVTSPGEARTLDDYAAAFGALERPPRDSLS